MRKFSKFGLTLSAIYLLYSTIAIIGGITCKASFPDICLGFYIASLPLIELFDFIPIGLTYVIIIVIIQSIIVYFIGMFLEKSSKKQKKSKLKPLIKN